MAAGIPAMDAAGGVERADFRWLVSINCLEALMGAVAENGIPKFEWVNGGKVTGLAHGETSEWIGNLSRRVA